jgi:hypothetical protein
MCCPYPEIPKYATDYSTIIPLNHFSLLGRSYSITDFWVVTVFKKRGGKHWACFRAPRRLIRHWLQLCLLYALRGIVLKIFMMLQWECFIRRTWVSFELQSAPIFLTNLYYTSFNVRLYDTDSPSLIIFSNIYFLLFKLCIIIK